MDAIAAISLDLDDTLWPMRPVLINAEAALSSFLRSRAPTTADLLASPWRPAHRARLIEHNPEWAHDVGWLRLRLLRDALAHAGEPVSLAEDAFEIFLQARQLVSLYTDVEPVLAAWAQRYRLIAITNGNADLGAIGLARWFDTIVDAREAGTAKPDPRIFHLACERAGVEPARVLHVGDDWHRDVQGARDAGLRAAWLRRDDLPAVEGPADEPRFDSLAGLDLHLHGATGERRGIDGSG
ncbi:MAG: HAD family hydrolase [Burkholderiaceae bacterium]